MKNIILLFAIVVSATTLTAQDMYNDRMQPSGFQKDHVFLGGSISLGFGSGSFAIGGNPEIGYSVAQWLDAGVVFNVNYLSQRDYYYDIKYSSFNYGGGVFVRAYPLPFLFVQLQPEQNWITYSTQYSNLTDKQTVSAPSLIGGLGYSQRVIGQGSYFLMIGLDLLNNLNSPYRDSYNHAIPIIRGGFDIYLRPSRKPVPAGPLL